MPKLILLLAFLLTSSSLVIAQNQERKFTVVISDSLKLAFKREKLALPEEADSVALMKSLQKALLHYYSNGYLLANYELNYLSKDSRAELNFFSGEQLKWARIDLGNLDNAIWMQLKSRHQLQQGKTLSPQLLKNFFEELVSYSEQNGYPFASINLERLKRTGEGIEASINYQPGPYIVYDTIAVSGDVKIKSQWLSAYLKTKKDEPFNQKRITEIDKRINELTFAELSSKPILDFTSRTVEVEIRLNKVDASTFNGIIGLLPNEIEPGKLLFTGQVDVDLHNLLNSGKQLHLQWQSLRPLTQLVNMQYKQPNVLYSDFDLEGSFYLLKEDSTFLSRIASVGFAFSPDIRNVFHVYAQWRNSSLLSNQFVADVNTLQDVDYAVNTFGISFTRNQFQDKWKLGKGYAIDLDFSGGPKRIKLPPNIIGPVLNEVEENSLQFYLRAQGLAALKFNSYWILHNRFRSGSIINQNLFRNDLFRLGGLQSQRGFNENYFFASDYFLHNMELRYFAEQRTYFYGFLDWSLIRNNYFDNKEVFRPFAIGTGMSLDTKGGSLQLVFALGKIQNERFNFERAKLHFGYLARF